MSRTRRHIPFFYRSVSSYEKTRIGLCETVEQLRIEYEDLYDPRHPIQNGRDHRNGQTAYYEAYAPKGWRDFGGRKASKECKRRYAKGRRRYWKKVIRNEINALCGEDILPASSTGERTC